MSGDGAVTVHVRLARQGTAIERDITVMCERPSLRAVLEAMAESDWGAPLFDRDHTPVRMLPGYLLVLNGRMVQSWEVDGTVVADGDKLSLAQVVPGG